MNTPSSNRIDWDPPGRQTDNVPFSVIDPREILDAFDGPRIFTFFAQDNAMFLAYFCDDAFNLVRFIIVPITPQAVQQLKTGDLALRDALVQPQVWIADLDNSGTPVCVWELSGRDLSDDILPQAGLTLLPDSISSLEAVSGEVPQPFDVHLGSKQDGMQVSVRWTGKVSGSILLWLDNVLVWGNPVQDRSQPVNCDPPHLLAFLASGWHRMFCEELYPDLAQSKLPEHPGRLRYNVLNVLRNDPSIQKIHQEKCSGFILFLKTHLLTRCSMPAFFSLTPPMEEYCLPNGRQNDDDSILFLKQGKVMLAATPDRCFYLSIEKVRRILEELGDIICNRLEAYSSTSNPFNRLVKNWRQKNNTVTLLDKRVWASGLSVDRLNRVWPRTPVHPIAANDLKTKEHEESLSLAARMVGNLSNDQQLTNLLNQLTTVDRINRQNLSELQNALEQTGLLGNIRDIQKLDFLAQGQEIAQWLRKNQNLADNAPADPKAILDLLNVKCETLTSAIPFDAIAVWGKTLGPVVFLNDKGPRHTYPTGIRFTWAHELGHLLMDMLNYLPSGDVKVGNHHDEHYVFNGPERRANAFAAELLMPEKSVKSWLVQYDLACQETGWKDNSDEGKNVLKMITKHFMVSHELAAWKIKHTRFFTKNQENFLEEHLKSKHDPF